MTSLFVGDSGEFHASITDLLSGLWHPAYPALRPAPLQVSVRVSCMMLQSSLRVALLHAALKAHYRTSTHNYVN